MADRGEWALPDRQIQISVSSYVDLYVRKLRLILIVPFLHSKKKKKNKKKKEKLSHFYLVLSICL
jgi:hypothetical protein